MRAQSSKNSPKDKNNGIVISNIKNEINDKSNDISEILKEVPKNDDIDMSNNKRNFNSNQNFNKPPLPKKSNLSLEKIKFTPEEKSFDLMRSFNSDQLINEESYEDDDYNEESSNLFNLVKIVGDHEKPSFAENYNTQQFESYYKSYDSNEESKRYYNQPSEDIQTTSRQNRFIENSDQLSDSRRLSYKNKLKNYFQNLRSRPLSYAEYYNNYPDPNPLINKSENSEDLGFGESDEEEPVTTVNMSIVHDRKDNYR